MTIEITEADRPTPSEIIAYGDAGKQESCRTCNGYGYARAAACWNCEGTGKEPMHVDGCGVHDNYPCDCAALIKAGAIAPTELPGDALREALGVIKQYANVYGVLCDSDRKKLRGAVSVIEAALAPKEDASDR